VPIDKKQTLVQNAERAAALTDEKCHGS
jgi:hypothetical protein